MMSCRLFSRHLPAGANKCFSTWSSVTEQLFKAFGNKKIKIQSSFKLENMTADVQTADSGSCHTLASISLAHAHQKLGNVEINRKHDEASVANLVELANGKPIREGGIPRHAFNILLGKPVDIPLVEPVGVRWAIDKARQLGGVLPYVPANCLRPEPMVIVDENMFVSAWNQNTDLNNSNPNWHAMMVAGVVSCGEDSWWLCKQSWKGCDWVVLPTISGEQLKDSDLWRFYTPHVNRLGQGYAITDEPLALADAQALPDSYSYLPDTGTLPY